MQLKVDDITSVFSFLARSKIIFYLLTDGILNAMKYILHSFAFLYPKQNTDSLIFLAPLQDTEKGP